MTLKQLSEDEIKNWTLEEKDQWWRAGVYKGDMPQLTIRSALTGMILGGILSLTNLYVGIKTGWTLGVGITSVILAFGMFRVFSKIGIGSEITLLENNAMQSIATAAGYMTGPLISSVSAYMLITGEIIPMHETVIWIISLSLLGVLFAFPLKKRFINDDQMPFPEGRAAGVVMDSLHSGTGSDGIFKARLLAIAAGVSAFIELVRNENFMTMIRAPFLKLPDYLDSFLYRFATPGIMGIPLKDITVRVDSSIVMVAAGGLMGVKTGISLITGAVINYFFLAPYLIHEGIIKGTSFKDITMWSLWGGVAMMTTASLFSFFSKPAVIIESFKQLFRIKNKKRDLLKDIELPMSVFVAGIPIVGGFTVYLAHEFFGVGWFMGALAVPLVFVFTLIAVNSTGLTSITPTGALGKLTQLTYSVLAPGNITTNIMTAGITGEVAGNASNLLMDIKPGYMLGAKPRHQAMGHVLGIFAGSILSVPVFYQIFHEDISLLTSEKLPMPSAQVWRAVAEVLTEGLSFLHPSAQWAILAGAIAGVVFEIIAKITKGKFPLSGVGMGLAFILPFSDSLAMSSGAIFFWFLQHKKHKENSKLKRIFVDNSEIICAGGIAGGALIGIVLILLETL
ncbi:MAG: OPT/YSL family transporter [Deltaproteobacteria bacterium]|nr:OPT/YSL family transporter [Deltaproteobacteria bacterium]